MFLDNSLCFINLFFLPVITMYIYFKRNGRALSFSCENLFIYIVLTAALSALCKIVTVIIKLVSGFVISPSSSYYTLVGIAVAAAFAVLIELLSKYISVRIEEKINDEK